MWSIDLIKTHWHCRTCIAKGEPHLYQNKVVQTHTYVHSGIQVAHNNEHIHMHMHRPTFTLQLYVTACDDTRICKICQP
eukprot:m.680335 g.680335  ORF g.680335 m.680335 type:complete len:79 (+) comp22810_c0_seq86:3694-3930(+)